MNEYTVKSILGQGGFGITYLAHDGNLERDVAIKEFMPQEMAARSADYTVHSLSKTEDSVCQLEWGLERFIREARTLSKFNHPNIVRVHTVFETNNTAYMVMSYEKGISFTERLKKGQPSEEELTNIVLGLLDGLESMHAEGFIHRDVKPGNIFIRDDGTALLLDFGSARQAMGEEVMTLTKVASPGYAPFEQYYGRSDMQGPWTDIYALGATMYRAITGEAHTDATFRNRTSGEEAIQEIMDILDKHKDKYSLFLLRAVEHAIRTNHKDRPQTVDEWRTMLTDPSLSTVTQWRYAENSFKKKIANKQEEKKKTHWKDYLVFASLIIALAALTYTYLQNS
ncbi:MAG: serine/threonine protein kinase [Proteobacteria bacterium]|nr:serine/threonine protein kinase [Pseudomonadota bacterium]